MTLAVFGSIRTRAAWSQSAAHRLPKPVSIAVQIETTGMSALSAPVVAVHLLDAVDPGSPGRSPGQGKPIRSATLVEQRGAG